MLASVSSASSTASSRKRHHDAIVSLNILLRSTPLPTVSSLQEITPSLLVQLYEVIFLVKLPYSTPRDPSPESQLKNIRILIGTLAHNVLQMDLSFLDPRKICDGDEQAVLQFLNIFIGVAKLRRLYPTGAQNLSGSMRQISGAGGGNPPPKGWQDTNGQGAQLVIVAKGQPNSADVQQHEVENAESQTASTTGSETNDDDDATDEDVCSPGGSTISKSTTEGAHDRNGDDVKSFVEETVTVPQKQQDNQRPEVAQPQEHPSDDPEHTSTAVSDVTSIAPDVIERLNERVALQASRVQKLPRPTSPSEASEHSTITENEEKIPEATSPKLVSDLGGHAESPPPKQSLQPAALPLPVSFSTSDGDSVVLVENEHQDDEETEDIRENEMEQGDKMFKPGRRRSFSVCSGSDKSRSRRAMTASPTKVDLRYLSPEKTPIIGFDTSPSATMAYKAELRASFSEELRKDHEGTFIWDPTPPDVQTRPLMEFNSFYSTAEPTTLGGKDEAAVNVDFAALADALDESAIVDEEEDEEVEDEHQEDEESNSEADEPPEDEQFDGVVEPVKASAPKSMIPRPSTNKKSGCDKKELLGFFSGQRPIKYRKAVPKAGLSPANKPSGSKLPTRIVGQPSTRSVSPLTSLSKEDNDNTESNDGAENNGTAEHQVEISKPASENSPSPSADQAEDAIPQQNEVKPSTPLLSPEETAIVSTHDNDDAGSEPSPSPMPRSRPLSASTQPIALPNLTTTFDSVEISALPLSPEKPAEEDEQEDEEIPASPSSVATSNVSVSTVAWEDSPATAALKRKRFEAMEAKRQATENAKVGSKVAKLALDYGSWTPRSGLAKSHASGGVTSDEEMNDVPSEDDEDDDNEDDDNGEEGVGELEEQLRQLNEISMKESVKQTSLFRILMKARHI